MNIIKRNGSLEEFNLQKISNAINKAYLEIYPNEDFQEESNCIAERVNEKITEANCNVEAIQDLVEEELMKCSPKVAKAYITYRYKHQLERDKYKNLMNIVSEKLTANNVQNQNANMDEASFGGRSNETVGTILKQYALDNLVSKQTKENYLNNEIYIHDLDHYALGDHNCLSIPFDKLLANGFTTRQTDVRPAGSVNTAMQLVAVIMQLQSLQQFGGVSATHLDWTMVPYVRKSFAKHYRDGLKYITNKTLYKEDK